VKIQGREGKEENGKKRGKSVGKKGP